MLLAVAIPKTNSVPSRLRRRSAGRGGTLRDANGGATPAQANRRGTVQKVDVTIGSWASKEEEESNEESRGSYVLYKGGIPTVADMSFLTPVTFSYAPDNLPPNAPIRITHSGRGTLYMKVAGSDVLTPATPYPLWRCEIVFGEYIKEDPSLEGLPVTDQYALETEKEELFHMKQFKGEVPPSEGGLGQCYTKQGIIFYAQRAMGAAFGTPCYIYGATSDDAYERATAILDEAIAFEKAESFRVIAGDFYYREAKAKEYANYNAAWRYHCTFSSECPTPIHCIHEAYLTP